MIIDTSLQDLEGVPTEMAQVWAQSLRPLRSSCAMLFPILSSGHQKVTFLLCTL